MAPETPTLTLFKWHLLCCYMTEMMTPAPLNRPPQPTTHTPQSFMRLQRQHSGLCVAQWVRLFSLTPQAHVTKAHCERIIERETSRHLFVSHWRLWCAELSWGWVCIWTDKGTHKHNKSISSCVPNIKYIPPEKIQLIHYLIDLLFIHSDIYIHISGSASSL